MASIRIGKFHSKETKEKIGAASLGRKLTNESRAKLSVALKGREKPLGSGKPKVKIEVLDTLINKSQKYDSINEVVKDLGIKSSTINSYFKRNGELIHKRYVLKKI